MIKTPEQLEDAAIKDAMSTAVALRLRALKRSMLNYLEAKTKDEITNARLNGREVDVEKMMAESLRLAFHWTRDE